MRRSKKYGIISVILAVLFLIGCSRNQEKKGRSEETAGSSTTDSVIGTEPSSDSSIMLESTTQQTEPEVRDWQLFNVWNAQNNVEETIAMLSEAMKRSNVEYTDPDLPGMICAFYYDAMYISGQPNTQIQAVAMIPKPEDIPEEKSYVDYAFEFTDEENNRYIYYLADPEGWLRYQCLYLNGELVYGGNMIT